MVKTRLPHPRCPAGFPVPMVGKRHPGAPGGTRPREATWTNSQCPRARRPQTGDTRPSRRSDSWQRIPQSVPCPDRPERKWRACHPCRAQDEHRPPDRTHAHVLGNLRCSPLPCSSQRRCCRRHCDCRRPRFRSRGSRRTPHASRWRSSLRRSLPSESLPAHPHKASGTPVRSLRQRRSPSSPSPGPHRPALPPAHSR